MADTTPLKYPRDLSDKYYLSITFYRYSRPDPFASLVKLVPLLASDQKSGTIFLPIPSNLKNSLDLKWRQTSINPGVEAAGDVIPFGGDGRGGFSPGVGAASAIAATKGGAELLSYFGSAAYTSYMNGDLKEGQDGYRHPGTYTETFQNFATDLTRNILQRNGLALNPILTQQFSNPEFKQHHFSWKFSPDYTEESTSLKNIIDIIDTQSKPTAEAQGIFFGYPSIAKVSIVTGEPGKELYKIQPSVVTNLTVNYAPQGVPSFFAGTHEPNMMQMDLSLLEIVLNTRQNSTNNISTQGIPLADGINIALTNLVENPTKNVVDFLQHPFSHPVTDKLGLTNAK